MGCQRILTCDVLRLYVILQVCSQLSTRLSDVFSQPAESLHHILLQVLFEPLKAVVGAFLYVIHSLLHILQVVNHLLVEEVVEAAELLVDHVEELLCLSIDLVVVILIIFSRHYWCHHKEVALRRIGFVIFHLDLIGASGAKELEKFLIAVNQGVELGL